MLACPPVTYIDLETNSDQPFPYNYHLTKAKDNTAAFLFREDLIGEQTYPDRYITDISFNDLEEHLWYTRSTHYTSDRLIKITQKSIVRNAIVDYQKLRHSRRSE